LLARLGNVAAAEQAYQLAIGLEADPAVRHFLQQRRSELRVQAQQVTADNRT
jgi:RNA polymerase sigma-70 factor (ECF subfamily)